MAEKLEEKLTADPPQLLLMVLAAFVSIGLLCVLALAFRLIVLLRVLVEELRSLRADQREAVKQLAILSDSLGELTRHVSMIRIESSQKW